MNIKSAIDYKKNKIINLMIARGVQPEELSENIWNEQYRTINIQKVDGNIICKLIFLDNKNEIEMNYIYDKDKNLVTIEEIVNKQKTILWDRDIQLQDLINDLCELIRINYTEKQVEEVLHTLPEKIKSCIKSKIKIA